ncbi:sucrose-binding protein-like [Vigna umbellata]|uniref:sucrose-binding protein-like n=1 Tax=Vigna umbellata TaxID=87088 RepID=UPI001F5EB9FF|nr:sucrose-binding protein-like [Vigna umbellata]
MAIKINLSLPIFLFFLLAFFSTLASAKRETEVAADPELKTCKHQCLQQLQYTEADKQICLQRCDMYIDLKHEHQKQLEEKIQKKKKHEGAPREHDQEEEGGEKEEDEEAEEGGEEEEEYPYIFEEDTDFDTKVETDDGRIRVLKKFTEKSKLLKGIANIRLALLEAGALTFVAPRHFDSDVVLFNIKGRAVLGLVKESETEKFVLESGDMLPIPAGTQVYIVNRDENEKLFLAMLHIPVSTPGKFKEFFGPGGRDPESVLSAFGWNVLQAALQSPKGELEKLFEQQNGGSIFQISREQVQELAPKKTYWWPFRGHSTAEFNLFTMSPTFSNRNGILTEAGPDSSSLLQKHNIMLSFTNITKESMSTILYNSHATKIAVVIGGKGGLQIVCPHVTSSSNGNHEKSSPSYHRISGELKPGMVFVVPPGHPFVTFSSRKENLQILSFEINAQDNKKFTFAGKDNIVSSMDDVAKELGFNRPSKIVNRIFDRKESFFFPFKLPQQEQGHDRRAYA